MLQTLNHLHGPVLDMVMAQCVHISLVLWNLKLGPVLQMWPHQDRGESKDNLSAGSIPPNAAQEVVSLFGSEGMLLDHGQLAVHQDTQVPLCKATFQPVGPQGELVQDLAFPFMRLLSTQFSILLRST